MEHRPAIACLTANLLVGAGLRSILEKVAPAAQIELYSDFESFLAADPDHFVHCFVAAPLFTAHSAFFRERPHRVIVLVSGHACPGMHCLDMLADEEAFVHALMQLQQHAHRPEHRLPGPAATSQPLSEREVEVLRLIVRGLINKQIADRLGIGLTTVISHRRNIMDKLGIRSVAELVIYALGAGYIDPDEI